MSWGRSGVEMAVAAAIIALAGAEELEDDVDRVARTAAWVKCDAGYCGE